MAGYSMKKLKDNLNAEHGLRIWSGKDERSAALIPYSAIRNPHFLAAPSFASDPRYNARVASILHISPAPMTGSLLRTPLADWHSAHGGRMVDFAGWSMPVQYGSIVAEHQATRQAAGLFDVSHMGRLRLTGSDAASFLDRLLTRKVVGMSPGKIRYSLVCNESGGILDDVLVYHLHAPGRGLYHLLVVNASNREKIYQWLLKHRNADEDVKIADSTIETAMIAVQGPAAIRCVQPLADTKIEDLGYYTGAETTVCGAPAVVSRTGYTGEDGCELIIPAGAAVPIWERVLANGKEAGAMPAGLGARDTLRLEAAMPLYGHELTEQINPIQAGLSFAVNLEGRDFIGRAALAVAKQNNEQPVRVGLELAGRRAAREHYPVFTQARSASEGSKIGEVTSGTFSPTLQKPIAMAYVQPKCAEPGTELAIDIRGTSEPARVVALPFYKRAS
jgi:aminomethyltransferase